MIKNPHNIKQLPRECHKTERELFMTQKVKYCNGLKSFCHKKTPLPHSDVPHVIKNGVHVL